MMMTVGLARHYNVKKQEIRLQHHSVDATLRSADRSKVCRYNWHCAGSLCWLSPMLNINIYFSNKIYGCNFIKQRSETVMV